MPGYVAHWPNSTSATREVYRSPEPGIAIAATHGRGPAWQRRSRCTRRSLTASKACDFAVFSQRATVGTGRRLQVAGAGSCGWWARAPAGAVGDRRSACEGAEMDHWQYLIVLGAMPGDHRAAGDFGAGVYRQRGGPRRACCPSPRCSWSGTRWRSPRTCGPTTRPMSPASNCRCQIPIEEVLFFIVIPLCGLLTYNAVTPCCALSSGRADGAASMTGSATPCPPCWRCSASSRSSSAVLRTGLFRRPAYWLSMLIVLRIPDTGRRLADQAERPDRHLRRPAHQRHPRFRSTSRSRTSCSASPW